MPPSGTNEEAAVGHVPFRQTLGTGHGAKEFMVNDRGRINTENIEVMQVKTKIIIVFTRDDGSPTRYAFRVEVRPWQLQGPIRMCTYECFCHSAFLPQHSLGDQVGNFVPPNWHESRTRDGMVNCKSAKSGPIDICCTKE